MNMLHKPLFSEILRPRQLSDLALPQRDIDQLEEMVASRGSSLRLQSGACDRQSRLRAMRTASCSNRARCENL